MIAAQAINTMATSVFSKKILKLNAERFGVAFDIKR
jgi:hypothetical protein